MWDNIDEPLPPHEIRGDYKVYKLISPEGKVYYGITRQNIQNRWGKGKKYKFNKELTEDIEKYGWENFAHQILNKDMTQLEALLCESFYIGLSGGIYNPDVYNQTPFGTICEVHDEETRQQISNKVREYYATHENPGLKARIEYCQNVKAKPVRCVETGVEYPSSCEAARLTGINGNHIGEVCRRKRKTAGGFHWEFVVGEGR